MLGPRGEGRTYIPFPSQTDNTGTGVPSAGYITRCGTLANAYINTIDITGVGLGSVRLLPVLWSPGTPTITRQVVALRVAPAWATQRRRGSFGRTNRPPI